MFFTSGLFWFLMGMLAVLVGVGFKAFCEGRGWTLNWWKWLLSIIWYIIFSLSFYAWGTLMGENEAGAGLWTLAAGMFVCLIFGVAMWRILASGSKAPAVEEEAEAEA
jgi:hypothetical protein